MKKRILNVVLIASMIATLISGCGHEHTWVDATCEAPKTCSGCGATEGEVADHTWVEATCAAQKTCSVCGETEGESLPHTWVEVTCAAPKTCSECGETEGEALPHTWIDANFQSAKTCSECGETEGEAIEADFVKYNMPVTEDIDKEYDITTSHGYEGTVKITNYHSCREDVSLDALDGYVWQIFDLVVDVNDPYNTATGVYTEDYYNICGHDDTIVDISDEYEYYDYALQYTLNWNGVDYTECKRLEEFEWDGDKMTYHYYFCLPNGYDGNVVGILDSEANSDKGKYSFDRFDENSIFFRFPAAVRFNDPVEPNGEKFDMDTIAVDYETFDIKSDVVKKGTTLYSESGVEIASVRYYRKVGDEGYQGTADKNNFYYDLENGLSVFTDLEENEFNEVIVGQADNWIWGYEHESYILRDTDEWEIYVYPSVILSDSYDIELYQIN